jgi:hypothetical protein
VLQIKQYYDALRAAIIVIAIVGRAITKRGEKSKLKYLQV